ncbi:unnamed protein product [Prunus armeniaca]|uniref:Uncharacterized protein n=1 Tax=Prunus armeniaca TaxID=36596 RepID=A0A6J5UEZ6_PRUAR|nr:hypothetical protein GBA52_011581 [Prunus armeniaca]CAB4274743.1 unnamed protein product [Prunus armeniaca]CAB4305172.1 unnamed protein product [Prunus armeniaca]
MRGREGQRKSGGFGKPGGLGECVVELRVAQKAQHLVVSQFSHRIADSPYNIMSDKLCGADEKPSVGLTALLTLLI